jgi:hypothetical protein
MEGRCTATTTRKKGISEKGNKRRAKEWQRMMGRYHARDLSSTATTTATIG